MLPHDLEIIVPDSLSACEATLLLIRTLTVTQPKEELQPDIGLSLISITAEKNLLR
jgi:hypothetical protein